MKTISSFPSRDLLNLNIYFLYDLIRSMYIALFFGVEGTTKIKECK